MRRVAQGYTLIEMMAVVAIGAILFAIASPAIASAKESARQKTCVSNLRQIHLALSLYTNDAGNAGPTGLSYLPISSAINRLSDYGLDPAQKICPDSSIRPPSSSYMWQILELGQDLPGPDLDAIAEREGPAFRVVVCLTHDTAYFAPREQEFDLTFQKAFSISLRADGSVQSERGRFARLPVR